MTGGVTSVREIQGHLRELYGIDVSPDLISTVTDAVLDEVAIWQNRPLEPVYPLVFFDALRIKVRDEGLVRNKAIHIALGVRADGTKDVLGLWIEQNEGAKFWLRVMNELKNRGTEDVLLAVVDGLKGFPEAIRAVFPEATVQTCIVHLLRHSSPHTEFLTLSERPHPHLHREGAKGVRRQQAQFETGRCILRRDALPEDRGTDGRAGRQAVRPRGDDGHEGHADRR